MFYNQSIQLTEGETFVVKNEGKTFTPQTNTTDLKNRGLSSSSGEQLPERN